MIRQKNIRKYRIAAQLAHYDEVTQREMIKELCVLLGIGEKMFSHYMYVLKSEVRLRNMKSNKLRIVAQYFNVATDDLLN